MQKVILASQSRQRKMMMELLNIPFETIPADIDEKAIRSDDPKIQAEAISKAKAEKIAEEYEGVIVAGDLFCGVNGKMLEKPQSLDEAKEMLRSLSNSTLMVYCGFAYFDRKNGTEVVTCVTTDLIFRELTEEEIEQYVQTYPVLTWAASYAPLDYGKSMLKEIHGSFTGIHGLPLELLIPLLRQSGFEPTPSHAS